MGRQKCLQHVYDKWPLKWKNERCHCCNCWWGGRCGCISGGGRGTDCHLGSLNVLARSALPGGCISSLGFSQLWLLAAALVPQNVKPGGTEEEEGMLDLWSDEGDMVYFVSQEELHAV